MIHTTQSKTHYLNKLELGRHDLGKLAPHNNSEFDEDYQADTLVAEPELAEPPKYAVIMYNDDYTPMDFVVQILMSEFKHNQDEAMQIMMNIHNKGKGIAGVYSRDIAETKAVKTNAIARSEGHPLMTQIEPVKG